MNFEVCFCLFAIQGILFVIRNQLVGKKGFFIYFVEIH